MTKKTTDPILLNLYREGLTYPQIADRVEMTPDAVQHRIRVLKKQIRAKEPIRTAEELQGLRDRIRNLREQGLDMKTIGRQTGITKPQVYRHLQAIGLVK